MKKSIVFFIGHFLVAAALVCGGESRIEFGRDDAFRGMALLEGLDIVRGVDGTADLVLRDRQKGDDTPDIYLDFDEDPIKDSASGAVVRNENNAVIISRSHKMRGKGSAAFQYGARLLVEPKGGSLFPRGTMSEDFTIQFWMYPATLGEGEIIFHWENTSADFPRGSPVYQEISCRISGRVLIWTFTNFFQDSGKEAKTLILRGTVPLVPRTWRHHAVRFDAAIGLIEYLVDGEPEAIAHATKTGTEDGKVAYPHVAGDPKSPLVIGEGFTGFLDEFCVSRSPRSSGSLAAFSAAGGTAQTSVIDLGYGGSSLLRIEAVYRTVDESAVFFYYKISESPEDLWKTEWQPFIPGAPLRFPTVGRYLLVKAELFPDGQLRNSPRLMNFTVVYERNAPPPPPSFVAAAPGDGKVDLRWSPVAAPGLMGYLIYYGSRPGVYDGTESGLGPSPLRVENTTSLSIDGLANGKLYYFTITTYDKYGELNGQFSNEVNARPSRLYSHD